VKCYGCGQKYDPQEARDRIRHQYHIGDSGLARARLLNMLSECQAERDDWYLRAVEAQAEAVKP